MSRVLEDSYRHWDRLLPRHGVRVGGPQPVLPQHNTSQYWTTYIRILDQSLTSSARIKPHT